MTFNILKKKKKKLNNYAEGKFGIFNNKIKETLTIQKYSPRSPKGDQPRHQVKFFLFFYELSIIQIRYGNKVLIM